MNCLCLCHLALSASADLSYDMYAQGKLGQDWFGYWHVIFGAPNLFNRNVTIMAHENESENVGCEIATILSRLYGLTVFSTNFFVFALI